VDYSVSLWNHLKPYGAGARLATAVHAARGLGLGVELWLDWTAEPAVMARGNWGSLRRLLEGVRSLSAHSRLIHVFDLQVLREEIDLCAFVGADPLVLHPHSLGFDVGTWDGSSSRSGLEPAEETLIATVVEHARSRGVRLALENGPMDLLRLLRDFSHRISSSDVLGICVDTGHANMHRDMYPEPAAAFLDEFARDLFQFHVSDNHGARDDHIVPGEGNVGWRAVLDALSRTGYSGAVVLELAKADPEKAARDSIAYLDKAARKAR
jgi:sugar phosphate isomerase/epimerase